jgi:hypothetical protein
MAGYPIFYLEFSAFDAQYFDALSPLKIIENRKYFCATATNNSTSSEALVNYSMQVCRGEMID